ncbi:hypothetical protein PUR61_35005 [Streptomyces sp. BE20]|uniref:hypothetical protein n=1 Tax=Streptomyces sp. BE20 TaxID=3002525 RepID=UPI002E77A4C1|nr:hypothetical protein [Streptomyces sp. BE20]MEE1827362.1 hypothetical protein [Streptomyces sp. BE20]
MAPGLRLVVTDRSAAAREDREEREERDAQDEQRLRLHIGPGGRCGLRFPRAAPPLPSTTDESTARADADDRLPAEHRHALTQVFSAARNHDLALAVQRVDSLLVTVAASFGPRHHVTLTVAQVRADLAWLSGDARCAAGLWTLIADGWAQREGPASRPARFGARQAAASWREVPDAEAAASGAALLAMLLTVVPEPESNPLVRAVRRRMSLIGGGSSRTPGFGEATGGLAAPPQPTTGGPSRKPPTP